MPYYCFHPGLAGTLLPRLHRAIEKMPKLQTSCSTVCTDEMVVTTRDPRRPPRAGVLEFLLVNHPLDCPVCDKPRAAKCPLQDFALVWSRLEPDGFPASGIRRRRRQGRCRLRSDADAQPQSLHFVHAVRPLHARD